MRRASTSAARALSVAVAVLCAAPAGAQEAGPAAGAGSTPPDTAAPADTAAAPAVADTCDTFDLSLDGADARSKDEEAAFVDDWRPSLRAAAACLNAPGAERACIEVQGQYDDRVFDPAVARVMGSQRAAQIHRALGRSEAVITELAAMNVPYQRIHNQPPPAAATYRGVRVRVVPDCLAPPAKNAELPAWAASPEAVATTLRSRGLLGPPAPAPAPVVHAEAPKPAFGPFSVDAGLVFDFLRTHPDDAIGSGVRMAFGWGEGVGFYARALLGVGTSDDLEQRAHLQWGLSGGYRPLSWLRAGLFFAHRFGTFRTLEPWFEQSFHVGLESEQRIVQLERVSLWLGESIAPLGWRLQRLTVEDGMPLNTADRWDYALGAQIVLTVRWHLDLLARAAGAPR